MGRQAEMWTDLSAGAYYLAVKAESDLEDEVPASVSLELGPPISNEQCPVAREMVVPPETEEVVAVEALQDDVPGFAVRFRLSEARRVTMSHSAASRGDLLQLCAGGCPEDAGANCAADGLGSPWLEVELDLPADTPCSASLAGSPVPFLDAVVHIDLDRL